MKKSFFLSILLLFGISCANVDSSKYIINRWQLVKIKFKDDQDKMQYWDMMRENLLSKAAGMTDEQMENELKMLSKEADENFKNCDVSGKENIAFTVNSEYLDYNGTIKGRYRLSLDGKRLMIINKASCGRTSRPNMKPALHEIPSGAG